MNRLVAFQLGTRRDDRGRLIGEILQADDEWLESTHDFIQWLFPLPEPSAVNPSAPTLTPDVRAAFQDDPLLRQHLHASFVRMLRFYGLAFDNAGAVVPGPQWPQARSWYAHAGHNDLRITRILRSLTLLGLRAEARALLACLERLREDEPPRRGNPTAFDHWRGAVRVD